MLGAAKVVLKIFPEAIGGMLKLKRPLPVEATAALSAAEEVTSDAAVDVAEGLGASDELKLKTGEEAATAGFDDTAALGVDENMSSFREPKAGDDTSPGAVDEAELFELKLKAGVAPKRPALPKRPPDVAPDEAELPPPKGKEELAGAVDPLPKELMEPKAPNGEAPFEVEPEVLGEDPEAKLKVIPLGLLDAEDAEVAALACAPPKKAAGTREKLSKWILKISVELGGILVSFSLLP